MDLQFLFYAQCCFKDLFYGSTASRICFMEVLLLGSVQNSMQHLFFQVLR